MKFALASVVALFAFAQETPWTPFNDPGNRRQPERTSVIDVTHYKIFVRLDDRIPQPVVEGRVDIDFSMTASASAIDLDAEDMTISEITAEKDAKLPFTHEGRKLTVDLGRRAAAGEKFRLGIVYSANPKAGLFFISPDPAQPKKQWQVWSQGEPEENHRWFPCYDYPNDRATSEVVIAVRAKYRTISNGELVKSETAHGFRTEHWKMDVPHVAYLTSLVAGEFDIVEDGGPVPLRYVAPKGWHTVEEIRHTFKRTPDMMRFFAERTKVPYPYVKYDQVVADDFTWGGMENITATTLHPGTVVPKRSWADRDSDGLIAHELAHQWFGNLVTCRSWAHAWLNEGFATYMEVLWQEKVGGAEAMVGDLEDGLGGYLGEARNEYVRPVVCEHYTTPDDNFDSHIYPKGAWILHMLRVKLGNDAWWKGVHKYLTKHRAGVVSTDDFRAAMEEASGQDLKPFFNQWVFKAGHPEFRVTTNWDPETLTLAMKIEQIQVARKLAWKDLETAVPFFEVPIDIEIETKAGRKTQRVDIKERDTHVMFKLDSEPEIIDFDRDGEVLKSFVFERTPAQLAKQLERDDQPWHRWWAAGQLAGSHEGVAALRAALHNDPSDRVRIAAAKALGATATPEACKALLGKTQSDARVRKAVLESLAGHAKEAGEALEKAFKSDSSPACRAAAAASLGKRGARSAIFDDVEKFKEDEVVMPGILSGMLGSSHPSMLQLCIDLTERTVHPQIRVRATECLGEALVAQKEPAGIRRLIQLFDDANFRVRRMAIQKSGAVKDATIADSLEKRLAKEPEGRLAKEIRSAIAKIRAGK